MTATAAPVTELPHPYLLFLGNTTVPGYAKTAFGVRDWVPERCVGEYRLPYSTLSTGLPSMTPAQASAKGARSLLIGVASPGGAILPEWIPALIEALEAGLDIVSGLHARVSEVSALRDVAMRRGRRLIDVRVPPPDIPIATGKKRAGQRLLAVGTDCALGKKYTALAIARAFKARGVDVDFRATGQTGIMISGGGIPMDAVLSDFEAGAAEILSPPASPHHWDVIEGQGSLFHPAYAAVSLGLLHGSQPDVVVVCDKPDRTHILGYPDYVKPTIQETIELNVRLGSRTNPWIRCAGVSLDTSHLTEAAAQQLMARMSRDLQMPVADPVRAGPAFELLIDACLSSALRA